MKKELSSQNIILYQGPINIELVSFISNYLKQYLKADSAVTSRIYKVLIELIQNVSYYSAEQFNDSRSFGSGIGWFRVDENKEYFTIGTGNKIYKEHGPVLEKNSREINSLEEEELRELKRKTRTQAGQRDIGAHIGLIQTGLITRNSLILKIEPVDDKFSFFTITARINKS